MDGCGIPPMRVKGPALERDSASDRGAGVSARRRLCRPCMRALVPVVSRCSAARSVIPPAALFSSAMKAMNHRCSGPQAPLKPASATPPSPTEDSTPACLAPSPLPSSPSDSEYGWVGGPGGGGSLTPRAQDSRNDGFDRGASLELARRSGRQWPCSAQEPDANALHFHCPLRARALRKCRGRGVPGDWRQRPVYIAR